MILKENKKIEIYLPSNLSLMKKFEGFIYENHKDWVTRALDALGFFTGLIFYKMRKRNIDCLYIGKSIIYDSLSNHVWSNRIVVSNQILPIAGLHSLIPHASLSSKARSPYHSSPTSSHMSNFKPIWSPTIQNNWNSIFNPNNQLFFKF